MSDMPVNPPLPDGGPGDGTHEGDTWERENAPLTEPEDESAEAGSAESGNDGEPKSAQVDGALSPGSTATNSPTEMD